MKVLFSWDIQDGKLPPDVGRLVIYRDHSFHTNGPSMDHNDCVAALASRSKLPKTELMSSAYRFYWRRVDRETVQVSPVRRIDEDWADSDGERFRAAIEREFGRRPRTRKGRC